MEQENTGRISIDVVVVGVSVVLMMVFMCSMNHFPRTLCRVARSWIQSLCRINRATTGQNANQELPHPPNNDINEISMLESMDDVHLFLLELRLSAITRPNLNISSLTRYEFITNLIITEKVEATTSNDQGMSCAICLGDYQLGDIMCSSHNAKCNHQFHQICIYRWLLQNRDDCPCCRHNYLALSDENDSTPTPEPSPSSSIDITSDVENGTENPPRTTVESEEVDNETITGPIAPFSSSLDLPSTSDRQVESLTVASGGPSADEVDQEHGSNHYDERHGFF